MSKKTIIIAVVVILLIVFFSRAFNNKGEEYELVKVLRGDLSQTVSETGQVQKGDKINLSFKSTGEIERIYVAVGQDVARGTVLAKLDTSDLTIQLEEARASLAVYQAELNKLLAGPTAEEVNKYQTAVDNKQIALNAELQDLEDANEDAINVMDEVYLKCYNVQNAVDSIQRTYFVNNDQEGIKVRESKQEIESSVSDIKSLLDAVEADSVQEDINASLDGIKSGLYVISGDLKNIREVCETPYYRNLVSSADKTILDTQRTNVNAAITSITNAKQAIVSAQLAVVTAEGNLQAARDDLSLLTAPPREEDLSSYQNKVNQAQAQVNGLKNKINEATLRSPVKGQVVAINKRAGELVQPTGQDTVFVILPTVPYEIKVDIYEEDVVKLQIENPVEITLVAFPGKTFSGRVIEIDPAEKIVDGVVYYEVIVGFDETPENIKPGMSADIIITTFTKENVLMIPENVIQEKDGKILVKVLTDNAPEEKEVEIGLEGSDGMLEIISGLEEGEEVILR